MRWGREADDGGLRGEDSGVGNGNDVKSGEASVTAEVSVVELRACIFAALQTAGRRSNE